MEEELPGVGLKRLKKMLKKCRSELSSHQETPSSAAAGGVRCAGHCPGENHDHVVILASFCDYFCGGVVSLRFASAKKSVWFCLCRF
jgi:hypothetical protein